MFFEKRKKTAEEQKTLLLVDDDAEILAIVGMVLERNGYKVVTARDGEECLDKVQQQKFDIILLDYLMPNMDGQETLEKLKRSPKFRNIPVIILTGFEDKEKMANAQRCGAADYIVKPCDYDVLLAKIADGLNSI